MPVPHLVVILRRAGDELDAGLRAGERAAGYDKQHTMDERSARGAMRTGRGIHGAAQAGFDACEIGLPLATIRARTRGLLI